MDDTARDPVGSSIAQAAPETLAGKAQQPFGRMVILAVLAAAFIAFGSVISLVAQWVSSNALAANVTDP